MKKTPLRSSRPGQKRRRAKPRRDWSDARAKVDAEGACRLRRGLSSYTCEGKLEAAHIIGREHDPLMGMVAGRDSKALWVRPVSILPLCSVHHGAYDRHEVDVLHVLSLDEQLTAVEDAGSVESMRRRTAPTAYQRSAA